MQGTVLVTGGAGFIGSHVCDRLLAEGRRVIAVDDLSTGRIANLAEARGYGPLFTFYNVDIRADALRTVVERHGPEIVVHLAAQAGVRPSVRDPQFDASVNVLGLLNVLEAAAVAGTRKVVFTTSGGTIYGEPRTLPVKERARHGSHPVSPYGITKKAAEDYLEFYREARGLDYTILALANVYGRRQDPHGEAGVVAIFSELMLAGRQPTINDDGNQTRDYVFVDDVVHAVALSADKGSGHLLNIGTGLETSVNRIFQLLAAVIGYRGEPRFTPGAGGELRRIALDCEAAGRILGWRPWTHLEDGLAETVAWMREQGVGAKAAGAR